MGYPAMNVSIIIPALNEEEVIGSTIQNIRMHGTAHNVREILVVDGGSADDTVQIAERLGARVVVSPTTSRSAQMNYGARQSRGDVLYFLHADTVPPPRFDEYIVERMRSGIKAGCFRLAFDRDHWLLNFFGWCTRFDFDLFRFGDQSLFIGKELFARLGGFRSDLVIMEDQDMIRRIKKEVNFEIISREVTTSSRRYTENGVLRLQLAFTLITLFYYAGISQDTLLSVYKSIID